jgi:hypothetical protein
MRYKTGETCQTSGKYKFDGYVDGSRTPAPTVNEQTIPLERGETFPPIKSSGKACYWKKVG